MLDKDRKGFAEGEEALLVAHTETGTKMLLNYGLPIVADVILAHHDFNTERPDDPAVSAETTDLVARACSELGSGYNKHRINATNCSFSRFFLSSNRNQGLQRFYKVEK